jgi:hypothetical protein
MRGPLSSTRVRTLGRASRACKSARSPTFVHGSTTTVRSTHRRASKGRSTRRTCANRWRLSESLTTRRRGPTATLRLLLPGGGGPPSRAVAGIACRARLRMPSAALERTRPPARASWAFLSVAAAGLGAGRPRASARRFAARLVLAADKVGITRGAEAGCLGVAIATAACVAPTTCRLLHRHRRRHTRPSRAAIGACALTALNLWMVTSRASTESSSAEHHPRHQPRQLFRRRPAHHRPTHQRRLSQWLMCAGAALSLACTTRASPVAV